MDPISFKEVNIVYTAGNNPNTDQLPICIAVHPEQPLIAQAISKWKLSAEELAEINKTGVIYLVVMGTKLPPMCPVALNPFTELNFEPIEPR